MAKILFYQFDDGIRVGSDFPNVLQDIWQEWKKFLVGTIHSRHNAFFSGFHGLVFVVARDWVHAGASFEYTAVSRN